MTARRNYLSLLCVVCMICFSFLIGLSSLFKVLFNVDIHTKWIQYDYSRVTSNESIITAQHIRFPTETELQELEKLNTEILNSFDNTQKLSEQIEILYVEVQNAKVCSTTHKYFNLLEENFNLFEDQVSKIQDQISLFEEQYTFCLDLISKIPKFSILHEQEYNEFTEIFEPKYEYIVSKNEVYLKEKEEFLVFYLESQQIANDLFEEYFDLMCHIVAAESGICPAIEQCYVANVIENRIKDSRFPDNIHDVVYSPGQYGPVISGSINNKPSEEVIQVVSDYLHGYIDTQMPDKVVFQALFKQGKGTWKDMPSGHYFCY